MSKYSTTSKIVLYLMHHRDMTLHQLIFQAYEELYPRIALESLERKVLEAINDYANGVRFEAKIENWLETEYHSDD